ncbi:MAG: hypothetical protein KKD38_08995, partial [Candidatus Delongbacteria bacterium]|nr:hypothetical protein [Candidatus Delongbacteria bacterium]
MRNLIITIVIMLAGIFGSLYGNYSGSVVTDLSSIETTSQNGYEVIEIKDVYEFTKEIGNPQLPCKTLSYLLPLESSVESITIISTQIETISDKMYNVFPTQPPRGTDGETNDDFVEPNEDVYSSGLLYPSDICKIRSEEYR